MSLKRTKGAVRKDGALWLYMAGREQVDKHGMRVIIEEKEAFPA